WDRSSAKLSALSISPSRIIFLSCGRIQLPSRPASPNCPKLYAPGKNMFDPSSIIVGLEIGTSKVCAVVGELSPEGALNIVGLGQARSRGVRKGEIADAPVAEEDVRQAIVEAEQMA